MQHKLEISADYAAGLATSLQKCRSSAEEDGLWSLEILIQQEIAAVAALELRLRHYISRMESL